MSTGVPKNVHTPSCVLGMWLGGESRKYTRACCTAAHFPQAGSTAHATLCQPLPSIGPGGGVTAHATWQNQPGVRLRSH